MKTKLSTDTATKKEKKLLIGYLYAMAMNLKLYALGYADALGIEEPEHFESLISQMQIITWETFDETIEAIQQEAIEKIANNELAIPKVYAFFNILSTLSLININETLKKLGTFLKFLSPVPSQLCEALYPLNDPIRPNRTDPEKNKALIDHAAQGNIEDVSFLLNEITVNPNFQFEGKSAIVLALKNGHVEIVKLLLADPFLKPPEPKVLLRKAAKRGHVQMVEMLLQVIRDYSYIPEIFMMRLIASSLGTLPILNIIVVTSSYTAPVCLDKVLINAIQYGHVEVVELLLNIWQSKSRMVDQLTKDGAIQFFLTLTHLVKIISDPAIPHLKKVQDLFAISRYYIHNNNRNHLNELLNRLNKILIKRFVESCYGKLDIEDKRYNKLQSEVKIFKASSFGIRPDGRVTLLYPGDSNYLDHFVHLLTCLDLTIHQLIIGPCVISPGDDFLQMLFKPLDPSRTLEMTGFSWDQEDLDSQKISIVFDDESSQKLIAYGLHIDVKSLLWAENHKRAIIGKQNIIEDVWLYITKLTIKETTISVSLFESMTIRFSPLTKQDASVIYPIGVKNQPTLHYDKAKYPQITWLEKPKPEAEFLMILCHFFDRTWPLTALPLFFLAAFYFAARAANDFQPLTRGRYPLFSCCGSEKDKDKEMDLDWNYAPIR